MWAPSVWLTAIAFGLWTAVFGEKKEKDLAL